MRLVVLDSGQGWESESTYTFCSARLDCCVTLRSLAFDEAIEMVYVASVTAHTAV